MNTNKYIGEEYKFNGRGGPYDCLGLVIDVLADNGLHLPDNDGMKITNDWMHQDPERFVKGLRKYCDPVLISNIQQLDISIFLFKGIPRHAGVIIDQYRFIHIFENSKVHISKFSKWKKKIHSIWRLKER